MEELQSMGFQEEDISKALQKVSGNFEAALEVLLSGGHVETENTSHSGEEEIVVELEISQYTFSEGSSSCTAIAATVMQYSLQKLALHLANEVLNREKLSECIFEGVMKFNEIHGSDTHMAVDELGESFFYAVHLVGQPFQGLLNTPQIFRTLLEQGRARCNPHKYIGAVITKPPESVAIILPGSNIVNQNYYFFDSHSRPEQSLHGSYLVVTSFEGLLRRLSMLFPSCNDIDVNNTYSYMYNMIEASFYEVN